MTTPQSQCTNLELSKKLKELGYPQESLFKYCGGHTSYQDYDNEDGEWEDCENTELLGNDEYCDSYGITCEFTVASPTVAELFENLPYGTKVWKEKKGNKNIFAALNPKDLSHLIESDSPANALAKLLIHLLENKLIEL